MPSTQLDGTFPHATEAISVLVGGTDQSPNRQPEVVPVNTVHMHMSLFHKGGDALAVHMHITTHQIHYYGGTFTVPIARYMFVPSSPSLRRDVHSAYMHRRAVRADKHKRQLKQRGLSPTAHFHTMGDISHPKKWT